LNMAIGSDTSSRGADWTFSAAAWFGVPSVRVVVWETCFLVHPSLRDFVCERSCLANRHRIGRRFVLRGYVAGFFTKDVLVITGCRPPPSTASARLAHAGADPLDLRHVSFVVVGRSIKSCRIRRDGATTRLR
jgi:hypothetical protein